MILLCCEGARLAKWSICPYLFQRTKKCTTHTIFTRNASPLATLRVPDRSSALQDSSALSSSGGAAGSSAPSSALMDLTGFTSSLTLPIFCVNSNAGGTIFHVIQQALRVIVGTDYSIQQLRDEAVRAIACDAQLRATVKSRLPPRSTNQVLDGHLADMRAGAAPAFIEAAVGLLRPRSVRVRVYLLICDGIAKFEAEHVPLGTATSKIDVLFDGKFGHFKLLFPLLDSPYTLNAMGLIALRPVASDVGSPRVRSFTVRCPDRCNFL